jgi:hypothetical protein
VVSPVQAGRYLSAYVIQYRRQYEQFTSPDGGGYPALPVSPYLSNNPLQCYLARDGVVILDSAEPPYDWPTLGGVTTMAIQPRGIPGDIWKGKLTKAIASRSINVEGLEIEIAKYSYPLSELLARLTFGGLVYGIPDSIFPRSSEFWCPTIIRQTGWLPADRSASRYLGYCEILRHVDNAAWDERSAWVRAGYDLRRDFLAAATHHGAGSISVQFGPHLPVDITDRSQVLTIAANGLESLLNTYPEGPESIFHNYIATNPILLDVYGEVESKPRFTYPPGEAPLRKTFVEPDFVIRYWNQTYKLVELENPRHQVATQSHHPGVPTTHAAFQIAEWRDYINNHYEIIKHRFPGITGACAGLIVISRDREKAFGPAGKERYLAILRNQLRVDEIFTYDDLVHRAREVVRQLRSLNAAMIGYGPGQASGQASNPQRP